MHKTKILHFHHGNYCRAASTLYAKYTAISHTETAKITKRYCLCEWRLGEAKYEGPGPLIY